MLNRIAIAILVIIICIGIHSWWLGMLGLEAGETRRRWYFATFSSFFILFTGVTIFLVKEMLDSAITEYKLLFQATILYLLVFGISYFTYLIETFVMYVFNKNFSLMLSRLMLLLLILSIFMILIFVNPTNYIFVYIKYYIVFFLFCKIVSFSRY